ncbi:LPS export ABC transporter periplasmic protein LptC [Alkalilimnicola ehrlichii MLHE-1]|uniref:Lipopolysaccharide export system protein LptC n=1 Tax=Alkalilimnicola ehrlichii (strain ATCC BAA-1101 / DSM 17681 / MLHE-1) TaxID=187272 RepID=Q0A6G8_ALKEH|nr:LPS export ABC transporter periplasmic protein LptC [Alkalilimnicola ehrlichii]ABI57569.1 protein of unknown function DUF1239 [Alkalilimnicola ehrlichii MLHE-1]
MKTRINPPRLFTLIAVGLLIGVAWLIADRPDREPPPDPEIPTRERADYFMEGFTIHAADATGRWQYRLSADDLYHFPERGVWSFARPEVEMFAEAGANWYGSAPRGSAWDQGQRVLLHEEVRFWRPESAVNRPLELETRELWFYPGDDRVETEAHAVLRQDTSYTEGVGARAWLDQQRIELQSEVRGHHELP